MFTIPRVNVIQSSEGFSVEVLGHTGLLYVEGEKSIHISSEMLASISPELLVLYTSSMIVQGIFCKLRQAFPCELGL